MASFVITLRNLRFFAHHGLFDEERIVGNEFEVNILMRVKAPKEKILLLEQTINYAEVHRIVKEVFKQPKPLLETIATEIADMIKEAFPALKKISVQISKLHPPIPAFSGLVCVTYQKRYKSS